jgi:hypothetical protein
MPRLQCEKSPPVVLLPLQSRPLSPTVPSRSSPPWKALARSERLTAIETAVIADWHVQNTLFSCRVLRLWQDLVIVDPSCSRCCIAPTTLRSVSAWDWLTITRTR